MAAPTVIKWNDTGVPVLARTASAVIGVLDYCLPQRGWNKVFSGTNKAVYQAGTGERKLYRVLDDNSFYYNGNSSYVYCHAKITGYDSMTDVDTGTGKWGEGYIFKAWYTDTSARPWICIFDEQGFALITVPYSTNNNDLSLRTCVPHYIGETIPGLPGQTSRNVIAASSVCDIYNSPLTSTEESGNAAALIRCNRSIDGTRQNINSWLNRNGGQDGAAFGSSYPVGSSFNCIYRYPYSGEILYSRPMLNDALALSLGDYIPGLYHTSQKGNTFTNWQTYTSNGKTLMAFYVLPARGYAINSDITATNGGVILFDISSDFRI